MSLISSLRYSSLIYESVSQILVLLDSSEHLACFASQYEAKSVGFKLVDREGEIGIHRAFNLLDQELAYCQCDRDVILSNLAKVWGDLDKSEREEVA